MYPLMKSFMYLEIQEVIHAHFDPWSNSSPVFQDPLDKSHFDLKTCPWKFHNPTSNEMHSKQHFHKITGLGSYGLSIVSTNEI